MKLLAIGFTLFALSALFPAASQESALPGDEDARVAWAKGIWDSLDRVQGTVKLPNGLATLNVPDDFYYLNTVDSEKILVEVWGNPPGTGSETLGMLFPAGTTPFDQGAWAVTIEYEQDGYVSDDDAKDIDYDALLVEMKEDSRAANEERKRQGYPPIELIGWASEPYYDQDLHKMYWAKEVKFDDQAVNTLNYSVRVLGRQGVLVLNFIADMDRKALVESKLDAVVAVADFDQGSRYEDFDPATDKVAAYGLGALVAGKVIAKTGLLAAALIFMKKFGILVFIAIGALIGRLLRGKRPRLRKA